MRPRPAVLAALAAAAALAVPAPALADPFDEVFADYQRDAKIDPCEHTAEELQQATRDIPNDIEQYAPEFPAALDAAMEERARTTCEGEAPAAAPGSGDDATGGAAAPGGPAAEPAPGATTPNTPGQAPGPPGTAQTAEPADDGAIANAAARGDDTGGELPAPLVALLAIAALLAAALLVWGVFRVFAWEPRWLLGARHAVAEAGWRTGGAWADFTDWLRTRRQAS